MKKLFLVGALALTGLFATAQEGLQGIWFAGGQVSFSNTSYDADKSSSYFILPIAGTFITPSVAVGAGIGYIGNSGETELTYPVTKQKFTEKDPDGGTFVVKPLVRKYWNITGGLFFFGQAALPLQFTTNNTYTYVYNPVAFDPISGQVTQVEQVELKGKTKSTSVALELSPGFDYVINKWLTIETSFTIFSLGYNTSKPDVDGAKATNTFSLTANPFNSVNDRTVGALQVGVKFLF
jgi:hypothetical protein